MDFIIFKNIDKKIINNTMHWLNGEEEPILPENAISFTIFHQSDQDNLFYKEFRIGEILPTQFELNEIDNLITQLSFEEAYRHVMDRVIRYREELYSVYVENGKPHTELLNHNTTLVRDKKGLDEALKNELKTYFAPTKKTK